MTNEEKREDGIDDAIAKNDGFDDVNILAMVFAALDSCHPLLLQTTSAVTIVAAIVAADMSSTVSGGGREFHSVSGNWQWMYNMMYIER